MQLSNHFLISLPSEHNNDYYRCVIYITQHSLYNGALGVIINKPISRTLSDMFKNIDIAKYGQKWVDRSLYFGGIIKPDNGFFLRKTQTNQLNSFELTGNKDHLEQLVQSNGDLFMSIGYSAWAPNQLEAEIKKNNWLVTRGHDELIFDMDPVIRYDEALKLAGISNISSFYYSGDIFA